MAQNQAIEQTATSQRNDWTASVKHTFKEPSVSAPEKQLLRESVLEGKEILKPLFLEDEEICTWNIEKRTFMVFFVLLHN